MYAQILIATDGSELAAHALDQGLKLAKTLGSKVTVVTVTEPAAVIGGGYAAVAGTGFDPIPELIEAQHDFLGHVLYRPGEIHFALRQLCLRLSRRPAEQRRETIVRPSTCVGRGAPQ